MDWIIVYIFPAAALMLVCALEIAWRLGARPPAPEKNKNIDAESGEALG